MDLKELESKRQKCEIYTRCCGWYVPKHASNLGKQAEYEDRVTFDESLKKI